MTSQSRPIFWSPGGGGGPPPGGGEPARVQKKANITWSVLQKKPSGCARLKNCYFWGGVRGGGEGGLFLPPRAPARTPNNVCYRTPGRAKSSHRLGERADFKKNVPGTQAPELPCPKSLKNEPLA